VGKTLRDYWDSDTEANSKISPSLTAIALSFKSPESEPVRECGGDSDLNSVTGNFWSWIRDICGIFNLRPGRCPSVEKAAG